MRLTPGTNPDHAPFGRQFLSGWLGHAMIGLPTKYEVPNFTCYGNIKDVAKCGGLGQLGITQAYQQCHHSIECTQLPIRL